MPKIKQDQKFVEIIERMEGLHKRWWHDSTLAQFADRLKSDFVDRTSISVRAGASSRQRAAPARHPEIVNPLEINQFRLEQKAFFPPNIFL
jgi:hypothetical protein